jgi:tetratricopeptide (TPR) repeat protein
MRVPVLAAVSLVAISAWPQASEVRPLTAQQLLAWVAGGVSPDHLASEVVSRGLGFVPDEKYFQSLKSAGAPEPLLELLKNSQRFSGQGLAIATAGPTFEHLAAGAKALEDKDYPRAERELKAALSLDPGNADLTFALARAYEKRDDWEEAAHLDQKAVSISPDFWEARLSLAYTCYRVGDADCAESESRRVLQRRPQDA